MAWDDFCATVKRSVNPFTAGPKRPDGQTGASRKGHFVALLYFHQVEPEVALQHNQVGHRSSDGLGRGFRGTQGQIRGTAEITKSRFIRARLIQGTKKFCPISLNLT